MHTLISGHTDKKNDESSTKSDRVELFPIINVRFVDFDHPQPIKSITLSNFNKFVVVQGVVTRTANIGPKCLSLSFECTTCSNIQTLILPDDGSYLNPDCCGDLECKGRIFKPILSSTDHSANHQPRTVDRCRLILRDEDELCKSSSDFDHTERVGEPPTLECELTDDLANSCPIPGSFVIVCGVLKLQALQSENRRSSKGGQQNSFKMILHVNSIRLNCRERLDSFETQLTFSQRQNKGEDLIDYVKNSSNVFGLLIDSLCPHIYGYQFIKAGLLLALVGSGREQDDRNQFRDTIHVLIIGDPGLGKTHLLQACALTSPRGIYLSGNTTTVAGLTVALNRDNGKASCGNDVAVEAGALVMADGGCCCLDEFDKMSMQHHNALLEAMEQQQVSVAKAGAHCQFPARTSIVAAANPIGGRYNDKSLSASLSNSSPPCAFSSTKFLRPLLNRFDLIFSLCDYANSERDRAITEHLMRARNNDDCKKNILSVDELRHYIAKVKEQLAPTMDVKAARILLNYFESICRSKPNSNENAIVGNYVKKQYEIEHSPMMC
uniref:MCM domain-containing protein n=1 Tax=Romanomermis culicivorax TaxID=13658 RepID=A0A915HXR8_ROMCU